MPDVTAAAAEVGQMFLDALQNALGKDPNQALADAKASHGVTDAQINHADMGQVFDYMCTAPGVSPELQSYIASAQANYNSYGNVSQSGNSYSGGGSSGGGYSGGGSSGGGSAPNAQIVQQVTNNYATTEINDNHIDINGPVSGDIDIDQDNDHTDVSGDGNAVNTGHGDQNAATGDHSSAAQANDGGDAQSQSGSGVQAGGNVDGPVNTGTFTGIQNDDGTVSDSPVGDGNTVFHNEGNIQDSAIGFGEGDTGNVSHDYLEEGAAASGTGDATGQSVDTNVNSNVQTEHGPGDQNNGFGEPVREPVILTHDVPTFDRGEPDPSHDEGHDGAHDNSLLSDNFSPPVEVNVEGGAGDQHVDHNVDHSG